MSPYNTGMPVNLTVCLLLTCADNWSMGDSDNEGEISLIKFAMLELCFEMTTSRVSYYI